MNLNINIVYIVVLILVLYAYYCKKQEALGTYVENTYKEDADCDQTNRIEAFGYSKSYSINGCGSSMYDEYPQPLVDMNPQILANQQLNIPGVNVGVRSLNDIVVGVKEQQQPDELPNVTKSLRNSVVDTSDNSVIEKEIEVNNEGMFPGVTSFDSQSISKPFRGLPTSLMQLSNTTPSK